MHEATGPATVQRTTVSEGAVTREEVTCPPVLPDYQALMRGVDGGDQLITSAREAVEAGPLVND